MSFDFEKTYGLKKGFNEKCEEFCSLILRYNKVHNITGAKNKRAVMENIDDSLFPITFLSSKEIKNAIDIGTGAGFPGLILAMALPDVQITLFEPITKKSSFLVLAKSTLGLENVCVVNKRVEETKAFQVDLVTSRAVTDTKMLIKLCEDYLYKESKLLFYKGERVSTEIQGLQGYEIYKKDRRNYLYIKDINAT